MLDQLGCLLRTDGIWVVVCLVLAALSAIGAYAVGFVQGARAVKRGQDAHPL